MCNLKQQNPFAFRSQNAVCVCVGVSGLEVCSTFIIRVCLIIIHNNPMCKHVSNLSRCTHSLCDPRDKHLCL